MAKISFTKLGLNKSNEIKTITINEQAIEVRQYLPVNDKLKMIGDIIENSADKNNFANPVKIKVFTILEIFYNYTNINFTDKQTEDPTKLYDLLASNNLIEIVMNSIPGEELKEIESGIEESVKAYYNYKNSILGILETVSTDYSNLNLDATAIQEKLADPNSLNLLKDILTKMG